MAKNYVTVLSIAGSDSIGGAGIQADIKTCCALGVYAMTAITAVTAQNTMGVDSYEVVTPELLRFQLESVILDVRPDAVKIGMLPNLESQKTVASWLVENNIENIILDPVMVATSGDRLTSVDNQRFLREHLMPLTTLVTPNIPEAMSLSGSDDSSVDAMGEQLLKYCRAVLVKGGHATAGEFLADVLYRRNCEPAVYRHPKIETVNTHGTGCSLSTAIACKLALGLPLEEAVPHAIEWLQSALLRGKNVVFGHGHGPVGHLSNYNLKESE